MLVWRWADTEAVVGGGPNSVDAVAIDGPLWRTGWPMLAGPLEEPLTVQHEWAESVV